MNFRAGTMRAAWLAALSVTLCFVAGAAAAVAKQRPSSTGANMPAAPSQSWKLVWHDEFSGPDGSQPDPSRWTLVTGGSGFGNAELQTYTDRPLNAHLEKGNLVITAMKESYTASDGIARAYTSARMQTKQHFDAQYGRIEARIKVPAGVGLWPAFWMMGSNVDIVGWPECGEIDIMENIGKEPGAVHGTLHGPRYSGEYALTGGYHLPQGQRFSDRFHRFSAEWEPGVIRFYVDGQLFETQNTDSIPYYKRWAFDHPFYLLLNLAVGGHWPGDPTADTVFPATMLVDYVRVYSPAHRGK
ncbi:MAG TPA: glycoside hydrolase family 16 protein [Terracidiphilus sp.]|nr:glycoside hydrolase family 16 protein [Terracidiphilus sp.]